MQKYPTADTFSFPLSSYCLSARQYIDTEKRNYLLVTSGKEQVNPLIPMSDKGRISLYNINTIATIQLMRIEKNIRLGIISWSNTKFSELTS